jgi:hypothetical protein
MYIDIDLYHSFRVVEEWDHDVIQLGLLFPAHIHRQQIPAMKKTMAATIGKIIGRLPFCLQYVLCENSAPITRKTPLNVQNIVQHHLTQLVLHTQQTNNLFAIFNIVFLICIV